MEVIAFLQKAAGAFSLPPMVDIKRQIRLIQKAAKLVQSKQSLHIASDCSC